VRPIAKRDIDMLARQIAHDLFINGSGDEAERLVLWKDSTNQNLGGLAKRVVIDRVRSALASHRPKARVDA